VSLLTDGKRCAQFNITLQFTAGLLFVRFNCVCLLLSLELSWMLVADVIKWNQLINYSPACLMLSALQERIKLTDPLIALPSFS
jgi:hypothetical protein